VTQKFVLPDLWGRASSLSFLGGIVPNFTAQQPHQIFSNAARARADIDNILG
jgi:hypothetical protein